MKPRHLPGNVLVIDDSAAIRRLLEAVLRDLGVARICTAADGREAFECLDHSPAPFDLVFCDLDMPGIDGVETLRGLASRQTAGAVVLLSGVDAKLRATVADMAEQFGLRVLGALGKPFDPAAIARLLGLLPQAQRDHPVPAYSLSPTEIEQALEQRRIEIHYQPKIALHNGAMTGVEALARLRHPTYGLLPPAAFIPVAEAAPELITRLTLQVLEIAIAQAGRWRAAGLALNMAVNLSTQATRCLELPERVSAMTAAAGIGNADLTLELTESRLQASAEILHIISRLRLRGVRLALDDYGTGHSSLTRLKRLPFTELKLDRSFVHGAATDPDLRAILASSVELGRRLHMQVVAEGVEHWEDWRLLEDLGCDTAQGYLVSRPLPAERIPAFANRWQRHLNAPATAASPTTAVSADAG